MSRSLKQKEYILQLKSIRASKSYGHQKIVDAAEAMGEFISLSSVRRVFAENSENQSFSEETLRIIGRVLLETAEPTPEPVKGDSEQRQEYYEQIEALKAAVEYKSAIIDQLNAEIERLSTQVDRLRKMYENRDSDARSLLADVRRKDQKIDELVQKLEALRK